MKNKFDVNYTIFFHLSITITIFFYIYYSALFHFGFYFLSNFSIQNQSSHHQSCPFTEIVFIYSSKTLLVFIAYDLLMVAVIRFLLSLTGNFPVKILVKNLLVS